MSEALNIKTLIVILIAGVLLIGSNSMPFVNAQPTHTSLTIAVPSPLQGIPFSSPLKFPCTMEATLKDENDDPLQNMDIDFFWTHKIPAESGIYEIVTDCVHWIGTAKTDSNGIASLTDTLYYCETMKISANFTETTSYVHSSSEYVDIIIIDYTPHLVIIAVAIIGVVGYIIFRRRKKAITMPVTAEDMEPSKLAETLFTNIVEE